MAWDGNTIWDHPDRVKVNSTSDRHMVQGSNDVFKQLYYKKFSSWQITNVYQLLLQKQHADPCPTKTPCLRRRKKEDPAATPTLDELDHAKAKDARDNDIEYTGFGAPDPSDTTQQGNVTAHVAILFGSLDKRHSLLSAKEYSNTKENDRHARNQTGEQAKLTERLRQNAGRCAEDAYYQLEELKAIRKDLISMRY